ncbi:MAG: hypothetical protein GWP19_10425 [Planctomycetia bacterium]|nr:hypothetical protein [Planctomycetia bacterium]
MKNRLIILLLFISGFAFGQSVPNTNTFHLTDVTAIVGGNTLTQCFTNSVDGYFDPNYVGNKDRLSNFRNYSPFPSGKWVTAVVDGGYIYVSDDYGVTFYQLGTSQSWWGVDMNQTGKYQTAVVYGEYIYSSNDNGQSWVQRSVSKYWTGIAIDSTGRYQAAVTNDGYVYESSDSAVSWTSYLVGTSFRSIDISPSGKYQIIGGWSDYVYISTDYGSTWNQVMTTSGDWAVNVARNGSQYLAALNGSQIWVSTDGATWPHTVDPQPAGTYYWKTIDADNSGSFIVVGDANGYIWYGSMPSSLLYPSNSIAGDWSVTSGYNGSYMYAADYGGVIYISWDNGKTWSIEYNSTQNWSSIATN